MYHIDIEISKGLTGFIAIKHYFYYEWAMHSIQLGSTW